MTPDTFDPFTYYPAVGELGRYRVSMDEDGNVYAALLIDTGRWFPSEGPAVLVGAIATEPGTGSIIACLPGGDRLPWDDEYPADETAAAACALVDGWAYDGEGEG